MRVSSALVIGALFTFSAGSALAETDAEAEAKPAPEATAAEPAPPSEELVLTLADAIAQGIESNLDVAITRYDPIAAGYDHDSAWGVHEPNWTSRINYQSNETPAANFLQTGGAGNVQKERINDRSTGITGVIPKLGWTYDLSYTDQDTTSSALFRNLDPIFNSGLVLNGTLPILKGFLWGQEWVQVRRTKIAVGISEERFRQQVMDTVQDIAEAYWNLAARTDAREVAAKSLETARALLDQTEAQYEVGVVSRVEVVESEAGVADRDFRMIQAENDHRTAQDRLVDLVFGTRLRPSSRIAVRTADDPTRFLPYEVNESAAADKAFELRPELAIARAEVEQQEIQVKFARNQRLPQLDVVGSYGYQGLAGDCDPTPDPATGAQRNCTPGAFPRAYGDADDDFLTGDAADQWSAGLVLSIPLGNTSARANHRKSDIQLRQVRTRALRLEQSIILEVRTAVRNLRSAVRGIEAANRRVEAASEQLRAEQIRLEHGESTPFQVLQKEEDLVEAESQKISALQVYHDSVAALERAQGTILRDRSVVIEDARTLR